MLHYCKKWAGNNTLRCLRLYFQCIALAQELKMTFAKKIMLISLIFPCTLHLLIKPGRKKNNGVT